MADNHDPNGTWDAMVDYAMMSRNVRAFMSLFHCGKPVVCKVHGFCVAGGTDSVGRFLDHPAARAERLVRLNCLGPVRVCHHFGTHLRERGRGGIILISSLAGVAGTDGTVAYSAAKAFDLVLAQGLWAELHPHGVDVIGLVLGNVKTPTLLASASMRQ